MSLISKIVSALALMARAAQTVGAGMAVSAKASPPAGGSKPGSDPCEPTEEMKEEAKKASLPGCAFTIPEPTGPIKEEPFKPEPPPPAPPKPPPLPPKKLAPINRASAAKPPPVRPKATAPAQLRRATPTSAPPRRSELGKMMDRIAASTNGAQQSQSEGRSM
jgi:outer membrane biosynthesis protein TonB